jgi:hypothetical protein
MVVCPPSEGSGCVASPNHRTTEYGVGSMLLATPYSGRTPAGNLSWEAPAGNSLSSVEVRLAVQVVLGKVGRAMAVKAFAAKVQISSANVPRAINSAPTRHRTHSIGSCDHRSLPRSSRANWIHRSRGDRP